VKSILERVAAGDSRAVLECLERYQGLVHALARRDNSDESETDDAVQEVFIDLWRNARRYNPSTAAEATFVAMIARRRLVDRYRKRSRTVATTLIFKRDFSSASDAFEHLCDRDEVQKIRDLMFEIRPEERTILEMTFDRGMSQGAVARELSIPLGTVKTHARRGLFRLRELAERVDSPVHLRRLGRLRSSP
jgi:RNA polymerase sigma factor (sigma-70 family)